jgi:hypothetical protein
VPELGSHGSVRGARGNSRPYRESRRHVAKPTRLTQLYGPAVRCKPNLSKWRGMVLRICIRPLHRAFVLLAIMDIRAHPISFSERP